MTMDISALINPLRRFAYSLTGNPHDADDLLQNTLERLLNKPVPDDIEPLKWAFRVCRNLWIDDYRANKHRPTQSLDEGTVQEPAVDGERIVINQITLGQVHTAMDSLGDDQRAVLSLVAVQGMSYRDVSTTLNIPLGTVMSRLARARLALSQQLALGQIGGLS